MTAEIGQQTLEGTLERLTYQNDDSGYTVARLIPKGKAYEVTIVGALAGVNVGESLRLRGIWTTHPRFGRQFEIRSYRVALPATAEGMRRYLGSGLVRGVGPVNAARIVAHFGAETLEVIEEDLHRLREVPGIGPKRVERIASAWEEQKQIKDIMLFLQSYGVSTSLAVKIYKQYKDLSVSIVKNSPYQLAKDIYGIGFRTADKLARQMGLAQDAPERIQAGLPYALSAFSNDGHCYADRGALLSSAMELLEVGRTECETGLAALIASEEVIAVALEPAETLPSAMYLPPFYYAEQGVADKIRQLQDSQRDRLAPFREVSWGTAFTWLDGRLPIKLDDAQQQAISKALTEHISILTGGPGTGKSTIMGGLIELLRAKHKTVLLAAPTGRAAKRLSDTTGLPARTIHRLLEFKPGLGNTFLRDGDNPLDSDLVIVDEASMIDILLMNHLLKAVEAGTHLLLVGDADQLPSVGAGNVLSDLIESGTVPVTRLRTIFRQSEDSYIVLNAHRINNGDLPRFEEGAADFFLFRQPEHAAAAELVVDVVASRIPAKFGFDPVTDIQVLSPMHRGDCGVTALNAKLQARLNPPADGKPAVTHGSRTIRQGDRVMQIRNDYERQVFNGDMGTVVSIDPGDQTVTVDIDGVPVAYETNQLDELIHAFAVSIHKSQGSEFAAVVIPILTQHYLMLQRNLLYTAITRARKLVVLVGDRRAVAIAVHNNRVAHRNTGLIRRLTTTSTHRPSRAQPYAYGAAE